MAVELTVIAVLALGAIVGVGLALQRSAYGRRLQRNNRYQQLLARASHLIGETPDEQHFFDEICRLICDIEPVQLVWVGRPDSEGIMRPLAMCGSAAYLESVTISIRSDLQAGQGPVGRAWRERSPVFDIHALRDPAYEPWRIAARQYGLMGVHALPILCDGEVDAMLAVYFSERAIPDQDDRLLLERLASDLANGILKLREHHHNQRLATAMGQITEAVFILDVHGVIEWFNDGFVRLFDFDAGLVGSEPARLLDDANFIDLTDRLVATGASIEWEGLQTTSAGVNRWIRASATLLLDDVKAVAGVVVVEIDLSDEMAALNAERRLRSILDYTSDGVGITDRNGSLIYLNDGGRALVGVGPDVNVTGRHFFDLIADPRGRDHFQDSVNAAASAGRWEGEVSITRADGVTVPLSLVMMAHRDERGHVQYLSAIARSIADVKKREVQLSYLAEHDTLTGLPNRRALPTLLEQAISLSRKTERTVAIGVIDLDDFKPVNDRYGHHAGDELLVSLAKRMTHLLRAGDAVIRLAGDEFVVIFGDLASDESAQQAELQQALIRLHKAVEAPFSITGGYEVAVEMSIGLALYPADAQEADTLLREADAALYFAKQSKYQRPRWWRLRSEPQPLQPVVDSVSPPLAYTPRAAELLSTSLLPFPTIIEQAVELFYQTIEGTPGARAILAHLTASEYDTLKSRQAHHLSTLMDPMLEQETLEQNARAVGRIHALTGLTSALLVDAANSYRLALTSALDPPRGSTGDKARQIAAIIERRIDDDVTAQLEAMSALQNDFFAVFANPLPTDGAIWTDVVQAELELIASLTGMRAACLLRQGLGGELIVEAHAGVAGEQVAAYLNQPETQISVDPTAPGGQGYAARSWREARIIEASRLVGDGGEDSERWQPLNVQLHLTSLAAIPIQNLHGAPVGLLLLYGNYNGQFSSEWAQRFTKNLQQRWENLFYRIATPTRVLAREQAISYRELLLSGGLRMFAQPIIDLRTGQLAKIEGLARLVRPDGSIIGPAAFLTILGASERYQLFRLGLELLLEAEAQWRSQGLLLDVTINVDASSLSHPEFANWLTNTLQKWDFAPNRLILELLETDQAYLMPKPVRSMEIADLGVRLAIDDMGSGYSNWLRLIDIPASLIKIDHTFVARMKANPRTALSLLGTLIVAATESGQEVVVEGLEDSVLLEVATRLGATYGQGFEIARPMPADQLIPWTLSYHSAVDNELQSLLGAMAYHWAFAHSPRFYSRGPFMTCRLTHYFDSHGLSDSQGAKLHYEIHQHQDPPFELVDKLTRWFEAECLLDHNSQTDRAPNAEQTSPLSRPPASGEDWSWII